MNLWYEEKEDTEKESLNHIDLKQNNFIVTQTRRWSTVLVADKRHKGDDLFVFFPPKTAEYEIYKNK